MERQGRGTENKVCFSDGIAERKSRVCQIGEQSTVLPFKRPSWSIWKDKVKRRRKNGNKTEREREAERA